jgi:hypothetical protein
MLQYFEKVIRGTDYEDNLVIIQFLKGMIGQRFSFLNYYKEIPVSYDAILLSVENEMAEFEVHDYQAKVITIERRALIYAHEQSPVKEDLVAEAFYVNVAKKKVILCKFSYARISSDHRRFVRVLLDIRVDADLVFDGGIISGIIMDISLGGAAMRITSIDLLVPGLVVNMFIKLPDSQTRSINEVGLSATVVKIEGKAAPFTCFLEFHPEKQSQQQISYFINQRQVEIIKELKDENL